MKRTLSVIFSLCLLCLTCSGCMGEPEQVDDELVIYSNFQPNSLDETVFRRTIEAYNYYFPEVRVSNYQLPEDGDAQTALYAEMMAGRGPDLILIDRNTFSNIYKTCAAGAFCDLQPFLDSDPDYDPTDFYTGVLEAGQFDGRQLLFPLQFQMKFYVTTGQWARQAGFSVGNCNTQQGFRSEVLSSLDNGPVKMWIPFELLDRYLQSLGQELLDIKSGKVNLDSQGFRELSETIRQRIRLYPSEEPDEFSMESGEYFQWQSNYILNEECAALSGNLRTIAYAAILAEAGNTPLLIPSRDTEGKGCAEVTLAAGISNQSHNRQNAYEFIKLLTQDETVIDPIIQYGSLCPVRRSILEKGVEEARKALQMGYLFDSDTFQGTNPPAADPGDAFFEDFYAAFDSIGNATFYDPGVDRAYWYMLPYLEGEASLDECVKKAQDYLEVYLSE